MPLANVFVWFFGVLVDSVGGTLFQVGVLVGPLALLTVALHLLAVTAHTRLARRFGWRAVLWTGWLGTPIHEWSHAALCWVFGHNIEKMALFEPDEQSGQLGYVMHSWNPDNLYAVLGNFFIAVAPLAGGTMALYALLWIFQPHAAQLTLGNFAIGSSLAEGNYTEAIAGLTDLSWRVGTAVVNLENLATWQFWVFLYLALCVGSHSAPSPADYQGGWWAGLLLLGFWWVANLIAAIVGLGPGWLVQLVSPMYGPVLALFTLAAILSALSTAVVLAVARVLDVALGPPAAA